MANLVRDNSTVLVLNGVPFSLVREDPLVHYDVCDVCDLVDVCYKGLEGLNLINLCMPINRDGRWFFKTDWDILNKKILGYVDFNDPLSEDKL